MDALQATKDIWTQLQLPEDSLSRLELTGHEPIFPSSLLVGVAAQSSISAAALIVTEIDKLRNQREQKVLVDMAHALTEFRSERHLKLLEQEQPALWNPLAGVYEAANGDFVRVHTNFEHHKNRLLNLVGAPENSQREQLAATISQWDAQELETAAHQCGAIVGKYRSRHEWLNSKPGQALAAEPLIHIEKIADAPAQTLQSSSRPLEKLRVLDLTRVIAGPIATRFLAAHGAEVLRIDSPNLPYVQAAVVDTGRGKRSTHLDFTQPHDLKQFKELLANADIVVQAYRPGCLERFGITAEECAKIRPGIVFASLCAYGFNGPWADRRGFDSIVQTTTGINWLEAQAAKTRTPRPLPCQSQDHGAGYLLALASLVALKNRMTQGGSWHVKVSLARTGHWLCDLGSQPEAIHCPEPEQSASLKFCEDYDSDFGRLRGVKPSSRLSNTAPKWQHPSPIIGSQPPSWLS